MLAGPGILHTPLSLSLLVGADVPYVAPARFHEGLAPLVAHRQALGYHVAVVDVEAIYDGWSFGQTDPAANCNLLRHAVGLYYDPRPGGVTDTWREPDAGRARQRVLEAFQQGPRLFTYNGHANHFQWASTQRDLPQPYLFGTNDIYLLHKGTAWRPCWP